MQVQTIIKDVYPSKAQFELGDNVIIHIHISGSSELVNGQLKIFHLHQLVWEKDTSFSGNGLRSVELQPLELQSGGYGIEIELYDSSGKLECVAYSAFDVVKHWSEAPRYGFLSDFDADHLGDTEDIHFLNKHHINVVQFYDWMYRHDQLVHPQKRNYIDPMGRNVSLDVVEEKMNAARARGMKTMAYGAMYACLQDFYEDHKHWALYQNDGVPYTLADTFFIMDISEDSPWNDWIIPELKKVIEWGFDGIHLDQYGFPKKALRKRGSELEVVDLAKCFSLFINRTMQVIKQVNPEAGLIFNNVSNFPTYATAQSDQNLVYIEVWSPINSYQDLKLLIDEAKQQAGHKNVILAAYLLPFYSDNVTFNQEKAENGALTTMATIFANGAFHLLIGEHGNILTEGYYPNYGQMSMPFRDEVRSYYDFIVRYHDLLFDKSFIDLSFTHTGGYVSEIGRDNEFEFQSDSTVFAPHGQLGTVWTMIKENDKFIVIHLINLCGLSNDQWNKGKEQRPERIENIYIQILLNEKLEGAYWSTPDSNNGSPQQLTAKPVKSTNGFVQEVRLPILDIWSMVYFVKG